MLENVVATRHENELEQLQNPLPDSTTSLFDHRN